MSKKHFIALAKAFAETKPETEDAKTQWRKDMRYVADVCSSMNNMFSYDTFYSACGRD